MRYARTPFQKNKTTKGAALARSKTFHPSGFGSPRVKAHGSPQKAPLESLSACYPGLRQSVRFASFDAKPFH